ncbi:MAG: PD40 domain-containing protein [Thermomicrobiales bacterium]|nr:PD40 domain-containing protein [Thermomicrobiales bacterium]
MAAPAQDPSPGKRAISRALRLAPLLLLFAIVGALVERELSERAWLDAAYATAASVERAGDLVAARAAFAAIPGYRDANQRADALSVLLAPQEASYAAGREAMQRGDYAAAVEFLGPVATTAPSLGNVTVELGDAKRLLGLDLRREVDAARSVRDWATAEQTLRDLVLLDTTDQAARAELTTLQRSNGPLLVGYNRELWLMSPEGVRERQLAPGSQVIWPTWSPDRSQIAYLAPDRSNDSGDLAMYLVGVDGSEPRLIGTGVSSHAAPVWSPDGARIAYTSFAGYDPTLESGAISVRVVNLATGVETDVTGSEYSLAFNPSWSPDSQRLAFVAKDIRRDGRPQHAPGDVFVYRFADQTTLNLTEGRVDDVWNAAWSPLGDKLLLYSLFGQTWYEPPSTAIRLLELAPDELTVVADLDQHAGMPSWAPDGRRFAYTADENVVHVVDIAGATRSYEATSTLSGEITWSPDATALLATPWDIQGKSLLLDLAGEPQTTELDIDFDSNPPFVAPPQWASVAPVPPAENLSLAAVAPPGSNAE